MEPPEERPLPSSSLASLPWALAAASSPRLLSLTSSRLSACHQVITC